MLKKKKRKKWFNSETENTDWERIGSKSDEFPVCQGTPPLPLRWWYLVEVCLLPHPISFQSGPWQKTTVDLISPSVSWSVIWGRLLLIILGIYYKKINKLGCSGVKCYRESPLAHPFCQLIGCVDLHFEHSGILLWYCIGRSVFFLQRGCFTQHCEGSNSHYWRLGKLLKT